ncbi:MAG TPA: HlyD family efflux transporter periplasmic adaptor subunit [Candidatus Avilachnospira avistercoris]|nr:HlyD family efflux transporter periplasmic adaptor subunit [Candidatus Avilachnospira avistercoris]
MNEDKDIKKETENEDIDVTAQARDGAKLSSKNEEKAADYAADKKQADEGDIEEKRQSPEQSSELDRQIEELMEEGKPGSPKKKSKKKKVIIAVIAVIVILFLLKSLLLRGDSTVFVDTGFLSKGYIADTLSITGPVEGSDSVDVTSNIHAKITSLNVKEGDRVIEGETLLLTIDPEDLQSKYELAKSNYDLAVSDKDTQLRTAQMNYDKAVQDLNTAREDYNRKSVLYGTGDISKVEFETAEATLHDAERAVGAYETEGGRVIPDESLDIKIQSAKLELEAAQKDIENAAIYAPITGTVTRVNTKVGQFADDIENSAPILTIENLDELNMEIKVSEYSIGQVHPGQKVIITADILGEGNSESGVIESISPTGEEKGGGSTERVIPTKIKVTEEKSGLMAGITAKAQIILEEKDDTFVVPISAVGTDPATGQSVMQFILSDVGSDTEAGTAMTGTIATLPVETGIESDINVEILEDPTLVFDVDYKPIYLISYQPAYTDGMEVSFMMPEAAEKAADPVDGETVTAGADEADTAAGDAAGGSDE